MTTPATRWVPPEPRRLPELRADLLDYYDSDLAYAVMQQALRGGQSTIVPTVPGTLAPPAEVGAQVLAESERQLQRIAAEGLQEIYFIDRGRRAADLEVEFTDIDYIELDF